MSRLRIYDHDVPDAPLLDTQDGALFAAVVITVLPVLVTYIIFQRQLQGSVQTGMLK